MSRVIGWQGTINLPGGKLTTSNAVAAVERIASAYDVPPEQVAIEPTIDRKASKARVTIFTENPLFRVHYWPGPKAFDPASGIATVGVYADGEPVKYRFYRRGSGAVSSLISGSIDSGKSRFLDQLLAIERHSGLMVSWVCDPQRGQSVPDWVDHVDYFAGSINDGLIMLRAAEAVMYARNEHLATVEWVDDKGRQRKGKASFDPTPEMPQINITLEEGHVILAIPEAAGVVKRICNMSRKCGISVKIITQVPLLTSLGGEMAIRDAVASGNVFCFRTANVFSGQVAFNGVIPVDPVKLPRETPEGDTTAGLGYALGPSARPAPMRSYLVDDPYDWASTGTPAVLDKVSADARQKVWDEHAGRKSTGALAAAAPVPTTPLVDEQGENLAKVDAPSTDPPAPGRRATVKQRILAYLEHRRGEHVTTGTIQHDLDVPLNTVSMSLKRLEAGGEVTWVRHGMWTAAVTDHDQLSAGKATA